MMHLYNCLSMASYVKVNVTQDAYETGHGSTDLSNITFY